MAQKIGHVEKLKQQFDQAENQRRSNSSQDYSESDQSFSSEASTEKPEGPGQAQLNRIESQNNRIEHQNQQIQSQNKELLKVQNMILASLTAQSIYSSQPMPAIDSNKPSRDFIKQTGLKPQIPQRKRIQSKSLSKGTGTEASAICAPTSAKQTRNIAQKSPTNSAGSKEISSKTAKETNVSSFLGSCPLWQVIPPPERATAIHGQVRNKRS